MSYDLGDILLRRGTYKQKQKRVPKGSIAHHVVDEEKKEGGDSNRIRVASRHINKMHNPVDDNYDCLVHLRVGDMLQESHKNREGWKDKVNKNAFDIGVEANSCSNVLIVAGRHKKIMEKESHQYINKIKSQIGPHKTTIRYTANPDYKSADNDFITISTFEGRVVHGAGGFYESAMKVREYNNDNAEHKKKEDRIGV